MMLFVSVTQINDHVLVEYVRSCPVVWDLRQQHYRNNLSSKESTWNDIGKRLNCTGNEARIRFSTLRDKFRKEKMMVDRFAMTGEDYKTLWPLYDQMTFLEQVIKPRRKRTHESGGSFEFNDFQCYKDEPSQHYSLSNTPPLIPSPTIGLQSPSEAIASSSTRSPYNNINNFNSNSNKNTHQSQNSEDESSNPQNYTKSHNQYKSFGTFIGDHLTSLPTDDANKLMKNIMIEIINYKSSK